MKRSFLLLCIVTLPPLTNAEESQNEQGTCYEKAIFAAQFANGFTGPLSKKIDLIIRKNCHDLEQNKSLTPQNDFVDCIKYKLTDLAERFISSFPAKKQPHINDQITFILYDNETSDQRKKAAAEIKHLEQESRILQGLNFSQPDLLRDCANPDIAKVASQKYCNYAIFKKFPTKNHPTHTLTQKVICEYSEVRRQFYQVIDCIELRLKDKSHFKTAEISVNAVGDLVTNSQISTEQKYYPQHLINSQLTQCLQNLDIQLPGLKSIPAETGTSVTF